MTVSPSPSYQPSRVMFLMSSGSVIPARGKVEGPRGDSPVNSNPNVHGESKGEPYTGAAEVSTAFLVSQQLREVLSSYSPPLQFPQVPSSSGLPLRTMSRRSSSASESSCDSFGSGYATCGTEKSVSELAYLLPEQSQSSTNA